MRSERTISLAPTICQTARNSATAATPTTTRAEGWLANDLRACVLPAGSSLAIAMSGRGSRGGLLPGVRRQHLLGEEVPQALAIGRENRIVADFERPRPRQRHLDVGDHPARRG